MTAPRRDEEFFVGYLAVPAGLSAFLRRAVLALGLLVVAVAALLAAGQGALGDGTYEFGVDRELTGLLRAEPLPVLWVATTTADGDPAIDVVPLAGDGKHGPPHSVLALAGREVTLTGRWIRRGEDRLFEVSRGEAMGSGADDGNRRDAPSAPVELGRMSLAGEIVDSKCYLGQMKPGQGKSHKACAIRCISGGSPAALVARDGAGSVLVALLVTDSGRPLGPELFDVVAEPVEVAGELLRLGDLTLFATSRDRVRRLAGRG